MMIRKKSLVTGGAGFIGSQLVKELLNRGHDVTVIDDLSEGKWKNLPKHKNLLKYKASILDDISDIVFGKDFVFHLAAIPWPQLSIKKPLETHKVNVDGTLNILNFARKYKVKKFIFSSTYLVHPEPLIPYSLQKLIGEEYCKLFSKLWGLETIILRYSNVYGPGMRTEGNYVNFLPKFIKMMSENKTPAINGDGNQIRDFVHLFDVVSANIAAMEYSSPLSGKCFNVRSNKLISLNEVVELLNQLLEKNIKPNKSKALMEPNKISFPQDNRDLLPTWYAKISLEKGLKMLIK